MGPLARLLFGNERAVFSNGHFGFDVRPRVWLIVIFAILLGIFIYFVYVRPRFRLRRHTLLVLARLRAALIVRVDCMLFTSVVGLSSVVPRSSYIPVGID